MQYIHIATYILIALHFIRLVLRKMLAGKIDGIIRVDPKKYQYYIIIQYRNGISARAIVAYYENRKSFPSIEEAARTEQPQIFDGVTSLCNISSCVRPECWFRISTDPSGAHSKRFIEKLSRNVLTRAEAGRIRDAIYRCCVPTITYDILLDSDIFQNFNEDDSSWPYIPPTGLPK